MVMIVPVKERSQPLPPIGQRTKLLREIGSILEGLEVSLGVGIVIGDPGSGVRLDHPQVNQQLSDGFGAH